MVKFPIGAVVRNIGLLAQAHITPISTGVVILGMISAVVLSAKAGKEAAEDIEEVKEELETDELTAGEVVRAVWKRFVPTAVILILTISCLVVNTNRMMKRYAALSTAYALSETYLKDYMESTKESVGAKKEQAIRDSVMEKQVNRPPFEDKVARGIIETGYGDTLFYDSLTTRLFRSSMERVKSVERYLSGIYGDDHKLYADDYVNALIGISSNFEQMGWTQSGKFDGTQEFCFDYSSGLTDFGEPYVAIYHYRNRLTDLDKI